MTRALNVAEVVGATGFEPATSRSRTERSTKLSHAPMTKRQCSTRGWLLVSPNQTAPLVVMCQADFCESPDRSVCLLARNWHELDNSCHTSAFRAMRTHEFCP